MTPRSDATPLVALLMTSYLLSSAALAEPPPRYSYRVINVYPHDTNAFTQGLAFDGGFLYEGTGLYGQSTLRKVELKTGKVIKRYELPPRFFGEGITVLGEHIIQTTWRSNVAFVYDKRSFELRQTFVYPTQAWGLTHNGTHLILSDGTATLRFLDPRT
ncbi:MAG: glutaminyl-peptide cyclotransferase, partial [Acidiferrobacterales bacterium]|nr:glutaminyl-peptide cyclotransferase [Acidiferrobacterales bacterium]